MSDHGNPADLPDYDAPGEEWFASGAPEPVRFETAASPRPATAGIRWFVGIILGLIAVGVVALIVVMVTTIAS
ncbi:MAG TPA: hypothetical protein VNQ52_08720 [Microbacteriaceae bacterium]|nr:hypothetical protein [Microbacteriaceae bacterium]